MNIHQVKAFIADCTEEMTIFDILQECAKKLGWELALEKDPPHDIVRGMAMGTEEYMDATLGK